MKKALVNIATRKILSVVLITDMYPKDLIGNVMLPYPDASLTWVDVADDTTERDTYVSGAVVKEIPPPPRHPRIIADEADITAVSADQAVVDTLNLSMADIFTAIDNAFPAMTAGQRNIIKRIAILAEIGARDEMRRRGVFSLRAG